MSRILKALKSNKDLWAILTLGLVVLLTGGIVVLATDFVWDGNGPLGEEGGPALWTQATHWVQNSSYPQNANDNVTLDDVSPSATATFNIGSATPLNHLIVAGDSPTKMTLYLRDAALTVASLDLDDYGQLDLDQNFTVDGVTTLLGHSSWIDVASGKTCDLEDVNVDFSFAHLAATTTGNLYANDITIDADYDGDTRGLRFAGGTLVVDGGITLKSDQSTGTNDAKLWVSSGTVNITGGGGTGILELDGGTDSTRRAELDIDDNLQAEETRFLGNTGSSDDSHTIIDVASGKTAKGGAVVFQAGTVVVKSGSGTFKSGN